MDDFAFQLHAATADNDTDKDSPQQQETLEDEPLPSFGSMFQMATDWGKKLQEEVAKTYSKDINELAQTIKTGATRGIDELSTRFSQLKTELNEDDHGLLDTLKQRQDGMKKLMGKLGTDLEDLLKEAIVIEAPGSNSTEQERNAARKIIYDRRMAQLAQIQESEDTYLADPAPNDRYQEFLEGFKLEEQNAAKLLEGNPAMAKLHGELVPDKITEVVFWTRYFFQEWLVGEEEIRRKKLVEEAVAATKEEEVGWDEEEEEEEAKEEETTAAKPEKKEEKEKEKTEEPTSAEPEKKTKKKDEDNGWDEWE